MKEQDEQLYLENFGVNEIKSINFSDLHTQIIREPALLHPSLEEMVQSYENGLGVTKTVRTDHGETAIGYSRLIPLLSDEQKVSLGLPLNFPDIYELGTVFINPEFRGRGIAENLQLELLLRFKNRIVVGKLLVLGTTKTQKVLHLLEKMKEHGFEFYICRHTEFPNLSPLTCICTPPFGEGFQITSDCSKRVSSEEIVFINKVLPEVDKKNFPKNDAIACTMFVSSRKLAYEVDNQLLKIHGDNPTSQGLLIRRLKDIGYYD